MEHLLTFIVCFIIIYLVYLLLVVKREKGIEKFKEGKQLEYFKILYKLDEKKLDIKKFANSLALCNAFIMSLVVTVIEFLDSIILKILVGFALIITLMLITYKFLGEAYKKKEGK